MRNNKAVKEIYTENLDDIVIRYKWTDKNYEALPFLTKPIYMPESASLKHVVLHSFYYIEKEDGMPVLKQTVPKPYPRPYEYETINAAKKSYRSDLLLTIDEKQVLLEQTQKDIQGLTDELNIINYLELEE